MKKKAPSRALAAPEIPIREIRGQRVLLDSDLAAIYGVQTFRFNEAIKRNHHRFPPDFMFQLTLGEFEELNSSQTAMSSKKHRGKAYLPYAFTEHGALQAANVLRSERAIAMSVFVIRAFVQMRATLLETDSLAKKLAQLERRLTARLDVQEEAIVKIVRQLLELLDPPPDPPGPLRPQIGFKP